MAYANFQARGQIGAAAAAYTSCSLWQHWILDSLNKARDQTHILTEESPILNLLSHSDSSLGVTSYLLDQNRHFRKIP